MGHVVVYITTWYLVYTCAVMKYYVGAYLLHSAHMQLQAYMYTYLVADFGTDGADP